jgi:tetratricopeptide (TPR) repeat protein
MTTTLIVRDAILAVNGVPEKRGEARSHLKQRVTEVGTMDPRTAEECVEVLSSVANGEGADPEVLEALVIVALAHPALAKRLALPTAATGRRLAARLERMADVERTVAVLELLLQYFPGQESLERDLGQLMRRQGMVKDLVTRYFERARKLVAEGRNNEAAGWLREVLELDPSRKEAARMLRDLRFKRGARVRRKSGAFGFLITVLALSLGVTFVVTRELRLRAEFQALPLSVSGNMNSYKRRLADIEGFLERNPLWLGALQVLPERSELRVQLTVLEERQRADQEAKAEALRERLESADLCRARGLMLLQSSDIQGALAAFREGLQYGGRDWPKFDAVTKDVADLEAHLKEKR